MDKKTVFIFFVSLLCLVNCVTLETYIDNTIYDYNMFPIKIKSKFFFDTFFWGTGLPPVFWTTG